MPRPFRDLAPVALLAAASAGCGHAPPPADADVRALRATPEGTVKLFRESIRNRWDVVSWRCLSREDRRRIPFEDWQPLTEDRRVRRALRYPLHRIRRSADGPEVALRDVRIPLALEDGGWRLGIAHLLPPDAGDGGPNP